MNRYTILLALPDTLTEGSTPWEDTFLAQVVAVSKEGAVHLARKEAAKAHNYDGDLYNYAVLFMAEGFVQDISNGEE